MLNIITILTVFFIISYLSIFLLNSISSKYLVFKIVYELNYKTEFNLFLLIIIFLLIVYNKMIQLFLKQLIEFIYKVFT